FLEVREPDGDLALSGLRGVGTVDDVLADGQGEVAADGARGGLGHWVGATGELAPCVDGALALDDAGDQRCGGDELDELTEERLVSVLLVVLLCGLAVSDAEVKRGKLEALALDACDDFADVAVGDAVWLDEDESTFSHARRVYRTTPALSQRGHRMIARAHEQPRRRRLRMLHCCTAMTDGCLNILIPGSFILRYFSASLR